MLKVCLSCVSLCVFYCVVSCTFLHVYRVCVSTAASTTFVLGIFMCFSFYYSFMKAWKEQHISVTCMEDPYHECWLSVKMIEFTSYIRMFTFQTSISFKIGIEWIWWIGYWVAYKSIGIRFIETITSNGSKAHTHTPTKGHINDKIKQK